jgi:hypothetical protein
VGRGEVRQRNSGRKGSEQGVEARQHSPGVTIMPKDP